MNIAEDKLKTTLEDMGMEASEIDELVKKVGVAKKNVEGSATTAQKTLLEVEYINTPEAEWRKRASIAAKLISLSYDE